MGLTGVIYAAIVVAWAIFLVPLALRRHDETARGRSIQRFSSTMRVLSSAGRGASSRIVVTPPRGSGPPPRPRGSSVTAGATAVSRPESRAALGAAAARRRRVLGALVALALVTGVGCLLGMLAVWSMAVPLVLVAIFLVMARRSVRLADESYWQRAANSRPESTNVVRRAAARVDASHGVARPDGDSSPRTDSQGSEPADGDRSDPADDEPTVDLTAMQSSPGGTPDVAEQRMVAISLPTSDGGSLWDPLPITLPTYVDKPVAKRTVRKVTIGEASASSSGHSASGATALPVEADVAAADGADGQQIAGSDMAEESRRAANA